MSRSWTLATTCGRLEIFRDGQWGTVSDDAGDSSGNDQLNNNMATVVCKMLGMGGGQVYTDTQYGGGVGPIWMDDVNCSGSETSIFDCPNLGEGKEGNDGGHSEDVGVCCTAHGSGRV